MTNNEIPIKNKVDIVYLWVDSNKKSYIKDRLKYSKKITTNKYWSPTKDNNEIIQSIKSVRKNMAWIKEIYILTLKNHKIKNIDEKRYNIKYITVDKILNNENYPCFNSSALELFQYKIPNLSEYFLALNDDFFINQKVELDDFYNFKTNKIKYYYEDLLILGKPHSKPTLDIIKNLNKEDKQYFWSTHMPRMFYKKDLEEFTKKYRSECENTKKNKFRHKDDIQIVYIYGYYLLSQNKGEFIFLNNITKTSKNKLIKTLFNKIKSEGIKNTLNEIYLQFFYKNKLYKNKIKSNKEMYSLISIGEDYKENKENIDYAINKKIKFICLNDNLNTKNEKIRNKIYKENYEYFYNKLLK